jgi:hypothetical protein
MARIRSTGTNRGAINGLGSAHSRANLNGLGSLLSYMQLQEDDKLGTFQGFGDVTARPSITGIDAVDKMLYSIEDQLATAKLAMTVTTISSLAAAIAGVILVFDSGKR